MQQGRGPQVEGLGLGMGEFPFFFLSVMFPPQLMQLYSQQIEERRESYFKFENIEFSATLKYF